MSKYFPKPKLLGGNVKVELDYYATKSEKKVNVATVKSNVDK